MNQTANMGMTQKIKAVTSIATVSGKLSLAHVLKLFHLKHEHTKDYFCPATVYNFSLLQSKFNSSVMNILSPNAILL